MIFTSRASAPGSILIPFTIPLPNMAFRIRIARDFTTESQRHGEHRGRRSAGWAQSSLCEIHTCTDTVEAIYSTKGVESDHLIR